MFSFAESSLRKIHIHHEDHSLVIEIGPEWNVPFILIGAGALLLSLYECFDFFITLFHHGRFSSGANMLASLGESLVAVAVGLKLAQWMAMNSLSKEVVRIDPSRGVLSVTTRFWKFVKAESFPIAEIKNLHSQPSTWLNDRERLGVEFYHDKYGYRFAQSATSEDRAKIVRLLEIAGASTLDKSTQTTSYSPSTPPR